MPRYRVYFSTAIEIDTDGPIEDHDFDRARDWAVESGSHDLIITDYEEIT